MYTTFNSVPDLVDDISCSSNSMKKESKQALNNSLAESQIALDLTKQSLLIEEYQNDDSSEIQATQYYNCDCPICFQIMAEPVKTPCKHVF